MIYALIGRSGSGKSHRAQSLSKEYGIECIIDDGLLINGNRVISGVSAKKEETKMAAVRRAIFTDHEHRKVVSEAIMRSNPASILILGTSDSMVDRIAQNLHLPSVHKRIYIEDIASPKEIDLATRTRKEQGKHVIPVPTFAIKKDFSGYFIDSVKNFRKRGRSTETEDGDDSEKTVVRPTYSYLGKYTIATNVIKILVSYAGEKMEGIHKVMKVGIENTENGLRIDMDISVDHGCIIPDITMKLQQYVKDEIEYMTAFNILEINIYVRNLNLDR